jgi:hypothetical protein
MYAALVLQMEEERVQLRKKVEASKREADVLNKEKRDLMVAKRGTQLAGDKEKQVRRQNPTVATQHS